MSAERLRVAIVEDDPLVRMGLRTLIGTTDRMLVVGEAADGGEVPRLVTQSRPDLVLMDIRMPRIDGLAAIKRLRAESGPLPRVLVLTAFHADVNVLRALEAGADGFLLKDTPPARILQAIELVAGGEVVLSPAATAKLVTSTRADDRAAADRAEALARIQRLSERELEVARLVTEGRSNFEIARRLGVTEATVKAHVSHILTRLEVDNRVRIAILVHRAGANRPARG